MCRLTCVKLMAWIIKELATSASSDTLLSVIRSTAYRCSLLHVHRSHLNHRTSARQLAARNWRVHFRNFRVSATIRPPKTCSSPSRHLREENRNPDTSGSRFQIPERGNFVLAQLVNFLSPRTRRYPSNLIRKHRSTEQSAYLSRLH